MGFIYICADDYKPNKAKVGMTTRGDISQRLTETTNPDYVLYRNFEVDNSLVKRYEKEIHELLMEQYKRDRHKNTGKYSEWFFCTPAEACVVVQQYIFNKDNEYKQSTIYKLNTTIKKLTYIVSGNSLDNKSLKSKLSNSTLSKISHNKIIALYQTTRQRNFDTIKQQVLHQLIEIRNAITSPLMLLKWFFECDVFSLEDYKYTFNKYEPYDEIIYLTLCDFSTLLKVNIEYAVSASDVCCAMVNCFLHHIDSSFFNEVVFGAGNDDDYYDSFGLDAEGLSYLRKYYENFETNICEKSYSSFNLDKIKIIDFPELWIYIALFSFNYGERITDSEMALIEYAVNCYIETNDRYSQLSNLSVYVNSLMDMVIDV